MASVNVKSRNDFVALVLKFYIGFLSTKKIEDYMLLSFSSVLSGTIHDSENRMARVVFKLAVELSKLSHVIAYSYDIDEKSMRKLHTKCVEEVKRINGAVTFEDAYLYQNRDI